MGATMLDKNCIVQCPIWYWRSVAKNAHAGESGVEGIKPVPAKTEAIKAMHPPVNQKQVHAFLGLVGYY